MRTDKNLFLPVILYFCVLLSDFTGSSKAVVVHPVGGGEPSGKQAQQQKGTLDPAVSSLVLSLSLQRYMTMW